MTISLNFGTSFPSSSLGTHSAKLLLGVLIETQILESRSGASKTGVPKPELGNEENLVPPIGAIP